MEGKDQLKVWLAPSCIEGIWKHVNEKHPRYKKGLLSEETEFLGGRRLNLGLDEYKRRKEEVQRTHTQNDVLTAILRGWFLKSFWI